MTVPAQFPNTRKINVCLFITLSAGAVLGVECVTDTKNLDIGVSFDEILRYLGVPLSDKEFCQTGQMFSMSVQAELKT